VESREFRLASRWIDRAVTSNRILLYLAGATIVLSFVAGILVHWIDKTDFPTIGLGIWWAVSTFTTVGYGDVVPTTTVGRVVAGIVMVFGITFISLITALITSALVSREQRRREVAEEADEAAHPPTHELLARIEQRLQAIERRL
jgi:voltage-gated potassium channel